MQDWEINDKFRQINKELDNIRTSVKAKTVGKERSTFKNTFNDIDNSCILCMNTTGEDEEAVTIPRFSPVSVLGYDTANSIITVGLPTTGNEDAILGITQNKVFATGKVRVKVNGLSLIRTNGNTIVIGDNLYAYNEQDYVGPAGDMTARTIFKSVQNSIENVDYVYCSVAGGGGIGIAYFKQASAPTEMVSEALNVWEDTDNGHIALYSHTLSLWLRITGFM